MEAVARTNSSDPVYVQTVLLPHASRLLDYLRTRIPPQLRSTIDPQDVAQDALFAATFAIGNATFNSPDDVWSWLTTIARRTVNRHIEANATLKRGGHTRHLAEDELRHGSVIVLLQDLARHERTPSRSAARREFLIEFERSLCRLPAEHRDAVRLRYVDGLSLREAAGRLNKTEESTRKLAVRGLVTLRRELRSLSRYA